MAVSNDQVPVVCDRARQAASGTDREGVVRGLGQRPDDGHLAALGADVEEAGSIEGGGIDDGVAHGILGTHQDKRQH